MRPIALAAFTLLAAQPSAADVAPTDAHTAEPSPALSAAPLAMSPAATAWHPGFAGLSWGVPVASLADAAEAPPEDADLLEHWKLQAEAGINGSAGNSENFNLRLGLAAKRLTARNDTRAKLLYQYATDSGSSTQNRLEAEARNDYLLADDSPWSFFLLGKFEYDEFQDWKYRTQTFGGLGYALVRSDDLLLRGRVGAGFTKEFGGRRNEIIPEGLAGLDLEWSITSRTKFLGAIEVYPSFENASQYRLLGRAGLEILVDPELNLSLKMGVEDRYNSAPGPGRNRNDVDYFLTLAIGF